jgi:RNA polymerase sigma-70 factor (ECF subfamily)
MSVSLSNLFLQALGDRGAAQSTDAHLEQKLSRVLDSARDAWPGVDLDPETFFPALGRRVAESTDLSSGLETMNVEDLYLACALAHGDRRALAIFEDRLLPEIAGYVRRIRDSTDFVNEVKLVLSDRLLVGAAGHEPKIASYDGRGPLAAWLRVSAVHIARDLIRREEARHESNAVAEPRARDIELDLVKSRYAEQFKIAFQKTLATLTPEERSLLRFHYLEEMPVRTIARLYRLHHSTVARRIERARARILKETHRLLTDELELEPREFDDLFGLIESQLDVSVRRCLEVER